MGARNSGLDRFTDSRTARELIANKERILSLWEEGARQRIPAAEGESHPILIDTLPMLLDQLAEALTPDRLRLLATENSTVASEHGGERVRLTGFRLEDLITEYKLLRQVLFDVLEEDEPLPVEERRILNASLDQAMMEACTGYALVQSGLRDQLFSIMAHDLRNPLGVAATTANLILLRPTAQEVPQWAARIADSISRVDHMVQELLDAMRVQTGARLQLELEECDLVEVVRESLDPFRIDDHRPTLEAPDPVIGYFGREALRRAVENLTTNAIRYGSSMDPVTVTVRSFHGRALISVHNHGSHIPPDQQETLFRAFQRAREAEFGRHRGWGLGLAQARAVAESHGGSISIDSVPGAGTTFTIDIPADARPFYRDMPSSSAATA